MAFIVERGVCHSARINKARKVFKNWGWKRLDKEKYIARLAQLVERLVDVEEVGGS